MIDIAIVGGGPAGLSAAINVIARNRNATVFAGLGKETSALYKAEMVQNYLGMQMRGNEMMGAFYKHAVDVGVTIKLGRVMQIVDMGAHFMLQIENETITAKAVILATGISKKNKIKGEEEFVGKGVSYCATCDGMLYRGKKAVIVGEIREGEEDANFLSEICESVTYIPMYDEPKDLNDKVKIVQGKVKEVFGGQFVKGIKTPEKTIECDGVFLVKEAAPVDRLLFGIDMEKGAISVNVHMETSIPGVFACGDCVGAPYQVSDAVGQGLIAGQRAVKYIVSKERGE